MIALSNVFILSCDDSSQINARVGHAYACLLFVPKQ